MKRKEKIWWVWKDGLVFVSKKEPKKHVEDDAAGTYHEVSGMMDIEPPFDKMLGARMTPRRVRVIVEDFSDE